MANTTRTYTGNGTTTLYPVDFALGYLNKEYVYVYLAGSAYTDQLAYTWIDDTQIEVTTAVADGVDFVIRRVVPRDTLINDYDDGAILRERNLDDSFRQALMALEEVADGFAAPDGAFTFNTDIDMLGNKIKNLGTALEDGDAVSFEFLRQYVLSSEGAEGLVQRAEAAADESEAARDESVAVLNQFREDYAGHGDRLPVNKPDGTLFYYDGPDFTQGLYISYVNTQDTYTGPWELVSGVGPQGATGPEGIQGALGVQGEQGIEGPMGIQGQQGIQGALGDTGATGITGATGSQGPQGPQGVVGPEGDVGPQGPTGPDGPVGPQGIQGAIGVQGDTGDIGPQGATGPTGPQGVQGNVGPAGPEGPIGIQGISGAIGPQGVQGVTGPTGPNGADGTSFAIDIIGTLVEKDAYDDEDTGFTFYASDHTIIGNLTPEEEVFVGDNSTTQFELDFVPDGPQSLLVTVGGVVQGIDAYSVVIDTDPTLYTIVFTEAPFSGAIIKVREVTLSTGYGALFVKASPASGDWEDPIPFGKGPRGSAGPDGPRGIEGPQGVAGPQGAVGNTGATGPQGPIGIVGPQGPTGDVGPEGPEGIAGARGPTGATGPQGATGLQGSIGPAGAQGPQGSEGIVGPQGAQGDIGPQGQQGLHGDRGPTGIQGDEGERGPTGNQGPQGTLGATGPQGAQGPVGSTGARGDQGRVGPTGPKGPTGNSGPDGQQGPTGTTGAAGIRGNTEIPVPDTDSGVSLGPSGTVMSKIRAAYLARGYAEMLRGDVAQVYDDALERSTAFALAPSVSGNFWNINASIGQAPWISSYWVVRDRVDGTKLRTMGYSSAINSKPKRTVLADYPTGLGGGTISLSQSWYDFDEIEVVGMEDNGTRAGINTWNVESAQIAINATNNGTFCIFNTNFAYWYCKNMSATSWQREDENSKIYRVTGLTY